MSPVGSCPRSTVVTVGSCHQWAVVHGGQLSPVGSCPVGQLSGGQMSGGQLSGGQMSAHPQIGFHIQKGSQSNIHSVSYPQYIE